MFGLFGNKELKDAIRRIGVAIHRQIFDALATNEPEAGMRVSSFFTTGYLYGFIRLGFTHQGYDGEELADKYFRRICNGVLPGRLYDIVQKHFAALDLAKELGRDGEITLFETGIEAGAYDAGAFDVVSPVGARNLFKFLINEDLDYNPLPE